MSMPCGCGCGCGLDHFFKKQVKFFRALVFEAVVAEQLITPTLCTEVVKLALFQP
ncbi:MAG: hypothetical protein ACK48P_00325 [Holosporales bacterium]